MTTVLALVFLFGVPMAVVWFGYLASCKLWPNAACHGCHGEGRQVQPFGSAFRDCRQCGGTGVRKRSGVLLMEHRNAMKRREMAARR